MTELVTYTYYLYLKRINSEQWTGDENWEILASRATRYQYFPGSLRSLRNPDCPDNVPLSGVLLSFLCCCATSYGE